MGAWAGRRVRASEGIDPRRHLTALLVGCLIALTGCSSMNAMLGGNSEEQARAEMAWSYGENAIALAVSADPHLNHFEAEPHSLVLAVYQSAEPNAFLGPLSQPEGVRGLLSTGRGEGLLSVQRYIIEPDSRKVLRLDRAQGARYVGVLAGYYALDVQGSARLFKIDVNVKSEGYVTKKRTATPASMTLRLVLGAGQIVDAEGSVGIGGEASSAKVGAKGTIASDELKAAGKDAQSGKKLEKP